MNAQPAVDILRSYLDTSHGSTPKLWFRQAGNAAESRRFEVFLLRHARIVNVTAHVALAGGYRYNTTSQTLTISGHGFSAEQEIAETISTTVYGTPDAISYERF